MMEISVVNRTTVLTDDQVKAVIPAFQAQITQDWLPQWPGRDATLSFAGLNDPEPTTARAMLLDHTDQPGAGGYHLDDNGVPVAEIFVADAIAAKEAWTVDATHEILEMLGDPATSTLIPLPHGRHCLQEVCLSGDTVVPLTDGSRPPIGELAKRGGFQARCTSRAAKTVRVVLTDGTSIRCTPDHRFLLDDGRFVAAGDLASGDVLPSPTLSDGIDVSNVYAVSIGQNARDVVTRADRQDIRLGQPTGTVTFAAQIAVARHSSFRGGIKHILNMRSEKQMVREDACRGVARMTNLKTRRNGPFMKLERVPVDVDYFSMLTDLPVTFAAQSSNPQPTTFGLLNARPEAVFKRGRAQIIGGPTRTDGISRPVSTLPPPMRSTQAFGSQRSLATRHGTFHAKVIDRVEPDGQAEVFDLTVPEHHNFAVGAGVFVHNCDAVEADVFGYKLPGWPDVLLTDFCLPAYFNHANTGRYDFGGHLKKPAPALLEGGYLGIQLPNGRWIIKVAQYPNGDLSRRALRSGRTFYRTDPLLGRP